MGFFSKTKKNAGWLATSFHDDGVCVAHVVRPQSGLPVVELAGFYPSRAPVSATWLGKLAKEVDVAHYQCSTLLSAGEYQFLSVDAPNVPADELKTAMRWRLKDMLDYHMDDATIDVMDIPVDKNAPVRNRQMFAVAARNQLIQQRQDFFVQAKIPLSVIDVPELAQRNISQFLEPDGRGVALLSFDAQGGLLTVTHNGELYLARHIDMPLAQLEQADEARRTEYYDRIMLELQRSLDHFDRQYHFITLAKLVLGPIGSAAEGLHQYLASNLYLTVEMLALDTVLDISKVPDLRQPDAQRRFFLTLGAALRFEETVL